MDFTVLIVSADAGLRSRIVAALSATGEVVQANDMSSAMDELSLGRPMITVIDGSLPRSDITGLLSAIGDPDRVVLLVSEIQAELFEYGAFTQIPYQAGDRVLVAAVERLIGTQRMRTEIGKNRRQAGRLEHVTEEVQDVHHAINSPLTTILAEAELMLLDAEQLSDEHRESIESIQAMAVRLREVTQRLRELGAD